MTDRTFDEQSGKRHKLARGSAYLYVSNSDIMFSAEQEGHLKHQEEYSLINAFCRLASKAMKLGMSKDEVAEQLDKAKLSDSRTWVADIAQAIRE